MMGVVVMDKNECETVDCIAIVCDESLIDNYHTNCYVLCICNSNVCY